MAREFDVTWAFTSSGGGAAVQITGTVTDAAFFCQTGPASTATVSIQSALESTGRWATEASTSLSTGAATVLRVSGPFLWLRPHNNSTGVMTVRGIGVE